MSATITRAGVVLYPDVVQGWPLTRPTRTVVHAILNTDQVELTVRQPGPRTGTLETVWSDQAAAAAAATALAVAGAPWVWVVPGIGAPLTAHVLEVDVDTAEDTGTVWVIRTTVQEVGP